MPGSSPTQNDSGDAACVPSTRPTISAEDAEEPEGRPLGKVTEISLATCGVGKGRVTGATDYPV
ncbi:hypothetical protein Ssi02_29980 [Sinosporangium siamense]|uniref:Uncharacterized protein n=1 Tax=Sinosporangium siamense TaxID=1367973 RepID=A0A919RFI2_9ACTN|nr:hypothetical protein Ssi02_29980 [Sinosporangium siamense]